jgi:hypothetical protein
MVVADSTGVLSTQAIPTGTVTGTGTTNYLPKFTGASTIGNSAITDDGTTVTLNSRALSGTSASFSSSVTTSASFVSNVTNGYGLILNRAAVGNYNGISLQTASAGQWFIGMRENLSSNNFIIYNENGTDALTISKSNSVATLISSLGLGVTPNNSTDPSLESRFGLFMGRDETNLLNNAYFNSGWKYAQTGSFANRYYQDGYNGSHQWFIAPSGTAGNAISFTQAMTLTAAGRLLLGTTTESTYLLDVNGTGRFSGGLNINSTGTEMVNINVVDSSGRQGIRLNNGINSSSGIVAFNSASSTGTDTGGLLRIHQQSTSLSQPAAVFRQDGSADILQLQGASGALRFNIASTGAATFSSSVTVNGLITQGGGIYKVTGTFVLGGGATGTFYTFANSATNQVYFVTVRQQGNGANNVTGMCFAYGIGLTAYNLGQDNTNPVLYLTLGTSGTDLRLTTGSGYGTTTWEYTITIIK